MVQTEESVYEMFHNKEVQWNINDYKAASLYDLRMTSELSLIAGEIMGLQEIWDSKWGLHSMLRQQPEQVMLKYHHSMRIRRL